MKRMFAEGGMLEEKERKNKWMNYSSFFGVFDLRLN
jgi:hypothetical protein